MPRSAHHQNPAELLVIAFPRPTGFNFCVQPESQPGFAEKFFTPWRFGLLLALLIFAEFPQVLLGMETFVARDYGFFVYPLAYFQKNCFLHGEIPLWNPFNQCGVPFLAQLNTMPLYPQALIYLGLPLGWAISFFSLLHLWFGGLGMYQLARRWTHNNFAAAFAGTVFVFNGYSINLLMWPSHVATFAWMPWVVLATELAWREGMQKICLAAFAGALQILAGAPETILLTWLIIAALWLQQFIARESPRVAIFWRFPLVVVLVIALAAAQLFPFLDLIAHSQRHEGFADLRWSMPGFGWANFLVPMAFGVIGSGGVFVQPDQFMTSSYYLGMGSLWLALLAVLGFQEHWIHRLGKQTGLIRVFNAKLFDWLGHRVCWLTMICVVGFIFALGENTPVLPAIRRFIPQLSLITYPIKYVMVIVFAVPLLAAMALADLPQLKRRLLPLGAILLAMILGIIVWSQMVPYPAGNASLALASGLSRIGFLAITGLLLLAMARQAHSALARMLPFLLILITWADVFTHEPIQNPTVPPSVYDPGLAREKLDLQPTPQLGISQAMISPMAANQLITFALLNPKENYLAKRLAFCGDCNLLDDIPKADGFFSLTPCESDEVLSLFYSTTNASYPNLEAFMGISQITAPDSVLHWRSRPHFLPLVLGGQKPVFLEDSNALYALTQPYFEGDKIVLLPQSEESHVTVSNRTSVKILSSKFSLNSVDIEAEADAPSLITIAQTYYHNWQAEIDDQPADLLRANVAFQAVQMPAGKHHLHLGYRDLAFEIGAAISLCMWVNCGLTYLMMRRRLTGLRREEKTKAAAA